MKLSALPSLEGLKNIFNITDILNKYKRTINITYDGGDYITLSCIIVCHKIYLQIDEHHTKPIIYSGSEDVEDDQATLLSLLNDPATVWRRLEHAPRPASPAAGEADTIMRDIGDLIRFLRFLHDRGHRFFMRQGRSDSIMVVIMLETGLIEIDFFEDHIEYSLFQKDKASQNDQQRVLNLLAWYKGE